MPPGFLAAHESSRAYVINQVLAKRISPFVILVWSRFLVVVGKLGHEPSCAVSCSATRKPLDFLLRLAAVALVQPYPCCSSPPVGVVRVQLRRGRPSFRQPHASIEWCTRASFARYFRLGHQGSGYNSDYESAECPTWLASCGIFL